jgi:hypothetical protein
VRPVAKAVIEVDPSDFEKLLYILAYDVPSENIKHLPKTERTFLNSKRWFIRDQLRFRFGCAMLQKSLYRVPDTAVQALTAQVDKWRDEYSERGYEAKLRVFPIGTTDVGYAAFIDMEYDCLMAWLTSIEELLQQAITDKSIQQKALREHKDKARVLTAVIDQDFGTGSADYNKKRYKDLKEELDFVLDAIGQVESVAKIKRYD